MSISDQSSFLTRAHLNSTRGSPERRPAWIGASSCSLLQLTAVLLDAHVYVRVAKDSTQHPGRNKMEVLLHLRGATSFMVELSAIFSFESANVC